MSARLISITSASPRSGKTHLAASIARWLALHGHAVEVLHLGTPGLARVVATDGSILSRPAAVLAEAALVESGSRHEDRSALAGLSAASEYLIIESAGAELIHRRAEVLRLSSADGAFKLEGYGKLPTWNGPPIVPDVPVDVAAMEAWRVGGWPRVGVLTLPNLSNFGDFQIVRGAEWITSPPVGRFAVLFLPATSDPIADKAWLDSQALTPWLVQQRQEGCHVVSIGWNWPGATVIEPGDLPDAVVASRLIGRRLDPPLPAGETLDRLAGWLASWSRWNSLLERLHAGVVK